MRASRSQTVLSVILPALCLLAASPARAQTSPSPKPDSTAGAPDTAASPGARTAPDTTPRHWGLDASLALTHASGNERLTVLASQVGLTNLLTQVIEFSVGGQIRYGRSQGKLIAKNLRGSVNFDVYPEEVWSPFLFVTVEHDPFKKLNARVNNGVGAKRTFIKNGRTELSLSAAGLYSYDDVAPDGGTPGEIKRTGRVSWRFRWQRRINGNVRLMHVTFYQPAWNMLGDYLVNSQSTVNVTLAHHLALTVEYRYERDSRPPAGVLPDDQNLQVGVTFSPRW